MRWSHRAVVYGSTDVLCNQDHQTLNNTLGQNPCLIYAYMVGSCANVFVQVAPLNQSDTYPPPINDTSQGIESASKCTCSRIPYNLISACASCQGKDIDSWADYNVNCGSLDETYNFTANVPPGTALPVWATKQTNATDFLWDTALTDKGAGEYTSTNSSGLNSITSTVDTLPTGTVHTPSAHGATIDVSASIGLAATALVLSMIVIASFLYLWRKALIARSEKQDGVGARASTIAHSVLFNSIIFLSIILACTTTWTAVALKVGGVVGISFLANLLNFLVFTSWWTFVGSFFFLLAFLYDRCNKVDGTFTTTRLGTPYAHLTWLIFTWILWVLGASLFAAAYVQAGQCQLHCTQLRVIPAFAFIELMLISLALIVVLYSYWNAAKRSRMPKRLGRSSSQSKGRK